MTDEDNKPTEKPRSAGRSSRGRSARRRDASPPEPSPAPAPAPASEPATGGGTPPLVMAALAIGVLGLIVGAVGWNKADSAKKLAAEHDMSQVEAVGATVAQLQATQSALHAEYTALQDQFSPLRGQYDTLAEKYAGLEKQYSALTTQDDSARDALSARLGELQKVLESTRQRLDEQLQSYQVSLTDRYSAEEQARAEEMQGFRSAFGELSQSVSAVHADLGRSVQTWSLKEVEQLLMLANQRVQLADDPVTAHAALRLADARLAEIEDPALTEVRRAIAEESASLESLERVDVPGLALRLGALAGEVEALPLPKPEPESAAPDTAAAGDSNASGKGNTWVQAGRRLLDDMSGMISVRNVEETRKPMVPVESEYFVRENLRLLLNSAQFALLRGDQEVYAQLLANAGTWVTDHFDTSADAVSRFAAALGELQGMPIRREMPDIAASLAELRKIIESRDAS